MKRCSIPQPTNMLLDKGKKMRSTELDYENHTVGLLGATKSMVGTCWNVKGTKEFHNI
jgi:hypothetical protein